MKHFLRIELIAQHMMVEYWTIEWSGCETECSILLEWRRCVVCLVTEKREILNA